MKVLLDTHTFLWFVTDDSALSDQVVDLIESEVNEVVVSVASLWEMAIKYSIGKLKLRQPFSDFIKQQMDLNNFQLLKLEMAHINLVSDLPLHHRDPFDRMLIAQSITEALPIISIDKAFDAYGITRLW